MDFNDYAKAKKAAEKAYRKNVAEGKYPFLPALDEILRGADRLREERLGVLEIPIRLIAGTVTRGRQESFADNFMPLLPIDSEFALKWTSLLEYQEQQGIAEPVKVYEFLGRFYVLEGNKRVSVMKYLDNPGIPANVTRIHPPEVQSEEVLVYREFLRFYGCTKQYEPMLSQRGGYERLAAAFGQKLDEPWDWRAVQSLRSSYIRFSSAYSARGGEELRLSPGDAFLLFLDVYGRGPLGGGQEEDLRKKIKGLWEEYRVQSNREPIAFLRIPNIRRPRSPLKKIISRAGSPSPSHPLHVAFIYDGDPEQSRWIHGHEQGRRSLEERMQGRVRTSAYPGCASSEEFTAAVDEAMQQGAKIIFTTSPIQMNDTLRAAVRFPQVRFLNCSVHLSHRAVRSYYGRMYEVKFLLGALAAVLAEDHRIGYVCGVPLFGTVANINAFAVGAAMIDPKVQIHLTWSCLKDHSWRDELREEGISIVSGPDLIRPGREDREYGLYRYEPDGSICRLGTPIWDWSRFYETMVRAAMAGAWQREAGSARDQALNYWWGLSSGVIDIGISEEVPRSTRHLIEGLRKALMAGLIGPFEGELFSQAGPLGEGAKAGAAGGTKAGTPGGQPSSGARQGNVLRRVLSAGEKKLRQGFFEEKTEADVGLTPQEIVTMDWLHESVSGRIPRWDDLT
ncbi:MAG: BMP family ABC transporter substrate-binding protein, partial [Firmicutes bacterium]|nr:BMP family ABC transporter substrate-binding protein [Bacillota bacterium]